MHFRLHIPPALYDRRFRLLWLGQIVSIAGSQMQWAAIHWHIRELTGEPDPLALGGIGLARILPVIAFSLLGGAVADTFNRRRILLVSQSGLALVALALGWFTLAGHITIWHIYALTALQATLMAFDGPARQALIPNLVQPVNLPNAFSLTSIAMRVGSVVGPVLAGLVIYYGNMGWVYLINAVSFLAVIAALLAMGPVAQQMVALREGVSLQAIREGIHFILNQPLILGSMLVDFAATFFASADTMMPIVARDILKVGETGYGWLVAAQPAGALLAALVVSQVRQLRRQGPLFLGAVGVFGTATILFGLAPTFTLAWIALAVMGAADSVSTIVRNTIRQLNTPDRIRARMTSINQIFFQGGPQLGEVEAGLVASLFGVPFAIVSGGIGCLLATALIVRRWPQLARYNGDEPLRARAPA